MMNTSINAFFALMSDTTTYISRLFSDTTQAMMLTTAMAQRFLAVVALCLLCCLPGCLIMLAEEEFIERGPRVFAATRVHFRAMATNRVPWRPRRVGNDYWCPFLAGPLPMWWPLDFPLVLALDIALLPFSVPLQLIYGDIKKKEEKEEAPPTRKTEK